jgi:RNA polymerase sigma-70 factor (ECF subfamily)
VSLGVEYEALPDRELVERAQSADSFAYEVLVHRYNTRICIYLARMVGDDETGRDLAQDTFIKGWQRLTGLQGEKNFQGWLYRIATNAARDYLRRKRLIQWLPWEEYNEYAGNTTMIVAGPEGVTIQQEFLKFALVQIPLKYRQCVILQIVEERSQREIAALLGINERSVSTYVKRGLEKLRQVYHNSDRSII